MTDATLVGTVGFAVGAGVATFFAPCAYPLLPGYVGYYLSRESATLTGALARGVAASAGALVALGLVGGLLVAAGAALASRLVVLEPLVGALLVVLGGAVLAGRSPDVRVALPERRASIPGFAAFGGVYALAAAGCVVPLLFGVVAQATTLRPAGAALALAGYATATAAPLLGVTLLAAVGSDLLGAASSRVGTVQRLAGAAMVLAGLAQIALSLAFLGVV